MAIDLAIIGGTGLYQWQELTTRRAASIETPYGNPSAPIMMGQWLGKQVAFLPRHGKTHELPPHAINYCANLYALHTLGAQKIVSINAVGGIHKNTLSPPHLVIPNQIIDYTHGRIASFFNVSGDPMKHIDFTDPFCEQLRRHLIRAAQSVGACFSDTGTYGCTQGPRLESRAEIIRMERDGCDIVGMTGMPEACLARELDIHYASLSIVVNPAAGKTQNLIELAVIQDNMTKGVRKVKQIIAELLTHSA